MTDAEAGWYYCLRHQTVEPRDGCRAADRLGPYPTRGEAQDALAQAQQRNDAWDDDPRWKDDDDDAGQQGTRADGSPVD